MTGAPTLTSTDWYLLRGLLYCGWCTQPMVADWSDSGRSYRCATACRPGRLDAATVEADVLTAFGIHHPELQAELHDPAHRHHVLHSRIGRVLIGGEHRLNVIWRT